MMAVRGVTIGEPTYETDRMRFIGRHRTLAAPAALDRPTPLSNSEGPVLDPIVCIRQIVLLAPNESVRIDIVTGVAESRQGVEALTEKYLTEGDIHWGREGPPTLTPRRTRTDMLLIGVGVVFGR